VKALSSSPNTTKKKKKRKKEKINILSRKEKMTIILKPRKGLGVHQF
jgi:hypothetical protein